MAKIIFTSRYVRDALHAQRKTCWIVLPGTGGGAEL